MNTNSNVYTVVYTTVIVILVAAVLAVVSQSLKGKQEANEKADTISQMLTAAGFGEKAEFQAMGNAAVLQKYGDEIAQAFTVGTDGQKIADLSIENREVFSPSMLKKQNYIIKGMQEGQPTLPVFVFKNNVTVVPVYGAGLWGPVWGYIAFQPDQVTMVGSYFDHESETAGLGAKIKDDPAFQKQFAGEKAYFGEDKVFEIVKGGSPLDESGAEIMDNKVDAITGATMTSNGLADAINLWLKAYAAYFGAASSEACDHACEAAGQTCDKPCCQDKAEACADEQSCETK